MAATNVLTLEAERERISLELAQTLNAVVDAVSERPVNVSALGRAVAGVRVLDTLMLLQKLAAAAVPCAAAFHLWHALFTSSSTYSMMVSPNMSHNVIMMSTNVSMIVWMFEVTASMVA